MTIFSAWYVKFADHLMFTLFKEMIFPKLIINIIALDCLYIIYPLTVNVAADPKKPNCFQFVVALLRMNAIFETNIDLWD